MSKNSDFWRYLAHHMGVFVCIIFFSCSRESVILGPYVVPNTIKNIDLDQILYPHWFVMPGYEEGGSAYVVVFARDGSVWMRQNENEALGISGQTWRYDQGVFYMSQGMVSLGGRFDYEWDGSVYLENQRLVPGEADYSKEKLVALFANTGTVWVMDEKKRMQRMRCALLKFNPDGSLYMAVSKNQRNAQDLIAQWPHLTKINARWHISPLGDQLVFDFSKKEGYILAHFSVGVFAIDVNYDHTVYAMRKKNDTFEHFAYRKIRATFVAMAPDLGQQFFLE
ncbi:MAG: hypothetical protein ACRCVN_01120 [Spirochaetia bacterium]